MRVLVAATFEIGTSIPHSVRCVRFLFLPFPNAVIAVTSALPFKRTRHAHYYGVDIIYSCYCGLLVYHVYTDFAHCVPRQ